MAANAAKLFKIACDAGDARSCSDLGMMCVQAQGIPLDYSCAKRRFKQACDRDHARGCTNLGLMHQKGLKVRKHPRKALGLYERACQLGDGKACGWVGLLYRDDFAELPDSTRKAASALRQGLEKDVDLPPVSQAFLVFRRCLRHFLPRPQ